MKKFVSLLLVLILCAALIGDVYKRQDGDRSGSDIDGCH